MIDVTENQFLSFREYLHRLVPRGAVGSGASASFCSRGRGAAFSLLLLALGVMIAGSWPGASWADTPIRARAEDHLERAVAGGLSPEDFHHLIMAFSWRGSLPDEQWLGRALDRLSAAAGSDPLMLDEVRLIRAQIAAEEGRVAASREMFRAMGGLERWWVAGPTGFGELEDFPSLAVLPDEEAAWRRAFGTGPIGWVRLSGLGWPATRQTVLLATTVVSDREQPIAVRLGAAQAARVWVGSTEVLTTPWPLRHAEDQAVGGAWLRQGESTVVVAVASESDDWWLRVRLTAPDGSRLEGVREVDSRPKYGEPIDRAAPDVRSLRADLEAAVDAGDEEARVALAAFMVARRPLPETSGAARAACRRARDQAPGEARLLEWLLGAEPKVQHQLLEQAIEADPDLVLARLPLAIWLDRHGLAERAAEILGAAEHEPMARAKQLDLDASLWGPMVLPELAELAQRWPRAVDINLMLASQASEYGHLELVDEAAARLEALVPLSSRVVKLREARAARCGDGEALAMLVKELLDLDPNRPELRVRLARLYAAQDRHEEARQLLDLGLRRCPDHAELMSELIRLEHSLGNERRAVEVARSLLELRPQDRQAQRLLALLDDQAEDLAWLRSPEQLWQMADEVLADPPESAAAITLLEHHEIRLLPRHQTEERVQRAILVRDADKVEQLERHTLAHVPERQALRVLSARILRRDGSQVSASQGDTPRLAEPELNIYYDTRLRVLRFSEVEDGDLIEISYLLSETAEANETGPYKGGIVYLGSALPSRLVEVEIVGPEEQLPDWEVAHLEASPSREVDESGNTVLAFEWRDVPAVPRDVPAAPRLLVTPHLAYSNHAEWGELAAWYGRHVAPRVQVSRQVEETALRLTKKASDRREKIAALYRFVTDEIRYVGLELGEHRFRPFSAEWVLNHRIGDCKDKAALLVALLSAVEIPARMVLVRTSNEGPVAVSMALLEGFNHAIAYLPEDDLWLDGTASGHDPFIPPGGDQGARVLVVDGAGSTPQTSPVVGAGESHYAYSFERGDGGLVKLGVRVEDTGDAAVRRRVRLAGSNDPRRVARWLQSLFPSAELAGEPKLQMPAGRDPSRLELEATVPRAALLAGGGLRSYPGELNLVARIAPGAERRTPLLLPAGSRTAWTMEVDLGRAPGDLPPDVVLESPYGRLDLGITRQSQGYRLEGELAITSGLIPPSEAAALHEFLVAVERALSRPLEVP